jgi:hypothetical protein
MDDVLSNHWIMKKKLPSGMGGMKVKYENKMVNWGA